MPAVSMFKIKKKDMVSKDLRREVNNVLSSSESENIDFEEEKEDLTGTQKFEDALNFVENKFIKIDDKHSYDDLER